MVSLSANNVVVNQSQTLTLSCQVTAGNPLPSVTWSVNGKLITQTTDGRVRIENNGQVLNIQYVTLNDSGLYQCTANNTVGQDTRTTSVVVLGMFIFVLLLDSF